MNHKERVQSYFKNTRAVIIGIDVLKYAVALMVAIFSFDYVSQIVQNDRFLMPFHRRVFNHPDFAISRTVFYWIITIGAASTALWLFTVLKNFVKFTVLRQATDTWATGKLAGESSKLPPFPYKRDSFGVVLAELQDRDGSRVPNTKSPDLFPRWLILPEKALYTGVLVTGGIGSGKTASVAEPMLRQMIGHQREVSIRIGDGVRNALYQWSGLVTDEKGDFCAMTEKLCREWGREKGFIRLAPGGYWKWNAIYNPGQPTWSVGYTLATILRRFNKGVRMSDPFWDNMPKELLMDYLTLIDDAEGYYSISSFLHVLISQDMQNNLHKRAKLRWMEDKSKLAEIDRRWERIANRRSELGKELMGSLQASAKAGLSLFDYPEIRDTFSPKFENYYDGPCCPWPKRVPKDSEEEKLFDGQHKTGIYIPKSNIFTGFDRILDFGRIVGLDMPKAQYYDAASFVQIALKSAWQDSVSRRDSRDANGELLIKPRFGKKIGYCPTFIVADECQEAIDPRDQNFMAQCRSKRACCVWLTQSHTSIISAMGQGKEKDAEAFFQNCMTHVYFRQSDMDSIKRIEKEVGNKDVAKTSVSVTESGQQSRLSYTQGGFVNDTLSVSETKSVQIEEKPFFEADQLKQLPDYVAVIIASTGTTVLPATIGYTRPAWIFNVYPEISRETSWYDWPDSLKKSQTLESIPQDNTWDGWESEETVDEIDSGKGGLVLPMLALDSNQPLIEELMPKPRKKEPEIKMSKNEPIKEVTPEMVLLREEESGFPF